jgi:calcium uniporter protein, mitochondrial
MKFTISRRQSVLYEQKGFDLSRWEDLIDEGNKLRKEIKMIADEYDVTWNEKEDAKSDKVIKALEKERKKKKKDEEDEKEEKEED